MFFLEHFVDRGGLGADLKGIEEFIVEAQVDVPGDLSVHIPRGGWAEKTKDTETGGPYRWEIEHQLQNT